MFTITPNLIERVHLFNTVGQIVPPHHFNADRVGFYTGMQLEELAEKLKAVAMGHVVGNDRGYLMTLVNMMDIVGKEFKAGRHFGAVIRADREEMLDGDIDQLVVSAGSLVYSTPQFAGAVTAVLDANDAKRWPDGKFHHDENGKMVKPRGWQAPDLSPFVDLTGTADETDAVR